jgi:hypothetical protein
LVGYGVTDECGFIYNEFDRIAIVKKQFLAVTSAGKMYSSFFDGFVGLMPTPGAYGEDAKTYNYLDQDLKSGYINHMIFSIYMDTDQN